MEGDIVEAIPDTHHILFDVHGCKLCGMLAPVDLTQRVRHLDWHIYVQDIRNLAREAEMAHMRVYGGPAF